MTFRLAVVVGHNARAQGAVRTDTGETEYVWNGRIAELMREFAPDYGIEFEIFRRIDQGSYSREIEAVYAATDEWEADATMELHFNSASSAKATGTEMLSSSSAMSMRFAVTVQEEVIKALGLRNRGTHTIGGQSRGGKSLYSGKAPAILTEPFFGSSAKGQQATDEAHEQEALAHAYLRGAAKAFEVPKPTPANEMQKGSGLAPLIAALKSAFTAIFGGKK